MSPIDAVKVFIDQTEGMARGSVMTDELVCSIASRSPVPGSFPFSETRNLFLTISFAYLESTPDNELLAISPTLLERLGGFDESGLVGSTIRIIKSAQDSFKNRSSGINASSPSFLKDDAGYILSEMCYGTEVALLFASDKLKADPKFILQAVKKCPSAILHASQELKENKSFILEAIAVNPDVADYVAEIND